MRSSVFNSDVTKLILINFREIHVKKEIDKKELENIENDVDDEDADGGPARDQLFDFRNKKVPTYIVNFAQVRPITFFGIIALQSQS